MINSTAQLDPLVEGIYDRTRLERLVLLFVYVGYGAEKKMPAGKGSKITWPLFENLDAATTPLVPGVTPAGSQLSRTPVSATPEQFGDFIEYTDELEMVGVDGNVVSICNDLQPDQIADTFDQVCRDTIVAGTQVRYCGGSAKGTSVVTVDDHPLTGDIQYAVNLLRRQGVKPIKEKILPGVNAATQGIEACFIGIFHEDAKVDLEALADWTPVAKYGSQVGVQEGEVGKAYGVRFILTPNAPVLAGSSGVTAAVASTGMRSTSTYIDVYTGVIFGKGYYGNVRISGGSVKTILKQLGYRDPLDQVGAVGWKGWFTTVILNDKCGVVVKHACTLLDV